MKHLLLLVCAMFFIGCGGGAAVEIPENPSERPPLDELVTDDAAGGGDTTGETDTMTVD